MTKRNVTRRRFLRNSCVTGAQLSALSWSSLCRGRDAMQQIRIGVIGTGVRGKYLIGNLPREARVVAICDCSRSRMDETIAPREDFAEILDSFQKGDARSCRRYQDYRKMIDQENLDAVIIATPDHHHVYAALLAIAAGLDVYLEKPLSLTISEGRVLADAVKAKGTVLQVGSQQRTMEVNRFACEFVRDGGLGKITRVDLPNYPGPYRRPNFTSQAIPNDLNWDLFLGPAPIRKHNEKLWVKDAFEIGGRLWRGWDLFRDYSGHLVTNWGGHNIDMVQYALGMDQSGPVRVEPLDGVSEEDLRRDWKKKWHKKTPPPNGTFSNDLRFQPIRFTYADGIEMNLLPNVDTATFYGERGHMSISRNKFDCQPTDLIVGAPDEQVAALWDGSGHVARPHLENWLDCIGTRNTPNAPVEVGHRTATVCHLINIARELDRPLQWDPTRENFSDDDEANALLDRPRRAPFELPNVTS